MRIGGALWVELKIGHLRPILLLCVALLAIGSGGLAIDELPGAPAPPAKSIQNSDVVAVAISEE